MTDDQGHELAYRRGVEAGEVEARLASHDRHFAGINGSLADIAREMQQLALAVQRLGDQALARDSVALAITSALKERSERAWSPFVRMFAVIAALAGLAAIAWLIYFAVGIPH
jgi:hypothetical protein